ncbi:MAG TPA: EscU/YscU/HrcU family type III secretion system export apparatus switch protein [Solirubrobacteraceae bacterium]|nr:EscU/YscU/HrcU family type III secretion system export apparatus switch protein [Solirubrobacteraceae bacterium]
MAASGENRTEKATPKRREDARKRGQVARSADLSGAAVLLAGILAISAFGSNGAQALGDFMQVSFAAITNPQANGSGQGLAALGMEGLRTLLAVVAPILGACAVAALLSQALQAGGRLRINPLRVDLRRLSPAKGIRNLVGPNTLFEALKALAKTAAVGLVALLALLPDFTGLPSKVGAGPLAIGTLAGSGALGVAERAGFAYLLIGVVDFAWRRHRMERQLRMTKQEVREEARQHSIPTEVRQALRRRALALARVRMMAAVPQADVVVTNPTHYAVALRYDGSHPAPEVVAKGQELVAARIREIAQENDVPVISDPPLARSLYASCEVGDVIPAELYMAVARVLAFVYRLAGHRRASAPARTTIRPQRLPAAAGGGVL